MPVKQGSGIRKSGKVFGQGQKTTKMVLAGLYARVRVADVADRRHWLDLHELGPRAREIFFLLRLESLQEHSEGSENGIGAGCIRAVA